MRQTGREREKKRDRQTENERESKNEKETESQSLITLGQLFTDQFMSLRLDRVAQG